MIVCSCRNISDRHYPTQQQLLERLQQNDRRCCSCIQDCKTEIQRAERESRNQNNGKQFFLENDHANLS